MWLFRCYLQRGRGGRERGQGERDKSLWWNQTFQDHQKYVYYSRCTVRNSCKAQTGIHCNPCIAIWHAVLSGTCHPKYYNTIHGCWRSVWIVVLQPLKILPVGSCWLLLGNWWQMYYTGVSYTNTLCMYVILNWVHKMHGWMHLNSRLATILLAHDPLSSMLYTLWSPTSILQLAICL